MPEKWLQANNPSGGRCRNYPNERANQPHAGSKALCINKKQCCKNKTFRKMRAKLMNENEN